MDCGQCDTGLAVSYATVFLVFLVEELRPHASVTRTQHGVCLMMPSIHLSLSLFRSASVLSQPCVCRHLLQQSSAHWTVDSAQPRAGHRMTHQPKWCRNTARRALQQAEKATSILPKLHSRVAGRRGLSSGKTSFGGCCRRQISVSGRNR